MLSGRTKEQAEIDQLIAGTRSGRSGTLLLRGEAGIGKTALLAYAEKAAAGYQILHVTGIEDEAEIPYASLHLMVLPLLDELDNISAEQGAALRGAIGLAVPTTADRFRVGHAVLSLLASVAEERPLLCLVDDAQWIDAASADALRFAARRFDADGVALLFAARDGHGFDSHGLPDLWVGPLAIDAARELLDARASGLARPDADRVVSEAEGNPLALLELSSARGTQGRTLDAVAGRPRPVSERVTSLFSGRLDALPEGTRILLVVASADGSGDLGSILQAAARLGPSVDDLTPAEAAGLVAVENGRIRFRHPLIRSSVYQRAPTSQRHAAHRALASVYDAAVSPTRHAWHLAAAAIGPDSKIADLLVGIAEQARPAGGFAAVSAAYERAAELSVDQPDKARREALAAQAALLSGQRERAGELAERAAASVTDPALQVDVAIIRALLVAHEHPSAARAIIQTAAEALAESAPNRAAQLFFDAAVTAWRTGDASDVAAVAAGMDEVLATAEPDARRYVRAASGLAHLAAGRYQQAITDLRDLVDWVHDQEPMLSLNLRGFQQKLALHLGDLQGAYESSVRTIDDCRRHGALCFLPDYLRGLFQAQLFTGRHRQARETVTEALRLAEDLGQVAVAAAAQSDLALLAAIAGNEKECRRLTDDAIAANVSLPNAWAAYALGLLDLGLGRPDTALRRLEAVVNGTGGHLRAALFSLPTLVEAAANVGEPQRAVDACTRYVSWAKATGRTWAASVALRCQALLAPEDDAGSLYAQAVELGQPDGSPFEQAHTELLYGSWLRRQRQVTSAKPVLRSALDTFRRLGAHPWTARASIELRATGESLRSEQLESDAVDQLTPQELQVVRLAASGMSNRDIAAQLFLSPRTVGYHLYRAFPKLGVASRAELGRLDLGQE